MNVPRDQNVPTSGELPMLSLQQPGLDDAEFAARVSTVPQMQAAVTIGSSIESAKEANWSDLLLRLQADTDRLASGSMEGPEQMVLMQAKTLDLVFHDLLRSAYAHRDTHQFSLLLRLALRAQAQSARTVETLAALKTPAVFAQQVNMANQQVVSNHAAPPRTAGRKRRASTPPLDPSALPAETVRLAQKSKPAHRDHAHE